MKDVKRLTIGTVQIFFDENGKASFSAPGKERKGVEEELSKQRDFIDKWLDASEELMPRRITETEVRLRSTLKDLGRRVRRQFDPAFAELVIREVAQRLGDEAGLTRVQIEESVADTSGPRPTTRQRPR